MKNVVAFSILLSSSAFGQVELDAEASAEASESGADAAAAGGEGDSPEATAATSADAAAPVAEAPPAPPAEAAPVAAETAAAAPADSADVEAEAAALEAAMLETAADQAAGSGYELDLYGFTDFTYRQGLQGQASDNGQLFIGRLNLYLSADLGDRWKSLAEVRFTYMPHGAQAADGSGRYDLSVPDYVDLDRPVRTGGVILERAWLEYSAHPLLNVRVGQDLTPYGIWNVDHGSPVIIGSRRPFIIGERMFPEWQTGVHVHGSHHIGQIELGYNLTLSNGRGPIDMYFDMDANKAIGGRLYANFDTAFGQLAVGSSVYGGKYTNQEGDGFAAPIDVLEQYDEFSIAGDLKYTLGGFLLQSEIIRNDVRYTAEGRPARDDTGGGFVPDFRQWGLYALTGYRFEQFLGIMPFIAIDYSSPGPTAVFTDPSTALWTGLNIRPTPRVVLKVQYTYSWFDTESAFLRDVHYSVIDTQAAWSF